MINNQKADNKIFVCKFSKNVKSNLYHNYWDFKDKRANNVDLDEVAHYESPHQDLMLFENSAIFVSGS